MIKSIKPGRLAGLSDNEIARALSLHFDCIVEYAEGVAKIHCISDYDEPDKNGDYTYARLEHAMGLLKKVGTPCLACDRSGPHVKLTFNEVAMDVISGARAAREAAKESNKTTFETK